MGRLSYCSHRIDKVTHVNAAVFGSILRASFISPAWAAPSLPIFFAAVFLAFPASADIGHGGPGHAVGAAATTTLSEGQVKKVDKARNTLTLRHGPLQNLGMPGMTLVFRVQEAEWLDRVKPGDTIRFLADRVEGVFTVTRLETVR